MKVRKVIHFEQEDYVTIARTLINQMESRFSDNNGEISASFVTKYTRKEICSEIVVDGRLWFSYEESGHGEYWHPREITIHWFEATSKVKGKEIINDFDIKELRPLLKLD